MKTYLVASALLTAGLLATPAVANNYIEGSYTHTALVEICTHTKNDQAQKLNKTLREYRISRQNAVNKVMCDRQQLMTFARNNNAVRVVKLLQPFERLPDSKVIISDITAPAN